MLSSEGLNAWSLLLIKNITNYSVDIPKTLVFSPCEVTL